MTDMPDALVLQRLRPGDEARFGAMLDLFAEAFEDAESYASNRPGLAYRNDLLSRDDVIALGAMVGETMVGALVAYELRKCEQERSEIYLYDLAVKDTWRRRGVATALIDDLKAIAKARGAWVVYVQADHGDAPAIALYTKLGTREDVMHFDIPLD